MYVGRRSAPPVEYVAHVDSRGTGGIGVNVVFLGLTSLFTDIGRREHHRARSGRRPGRAKVPATELTAVPHLLFRQTGTGDPFSGKLGVATLSGDPTRRSLTPLSCEVVHFAASRGLCLATDRGVLTSYNALIFDGDFRVLHRFGLNGGPSRARVAPDGRFGSFTVFVAGHSYAVAGFSTETVLVDLDTGARLPNLEKWDARRSGKRFSRVDFNFWGVTWSARPGRFYVTLGTAGKTYLVRGDVARRRLDVLRENVECPSLSPDGTRLVYKKRVDNGLGPVTWRLHVLDLATMTDRPLAESRNVDDQAEWLDDSHVLYTLPRAPRSGADTWMVSVDDATPPRVFLPAAASPAVVRALPLARS